MEQPIVIAYDSKTGNVEWFANQLGYPVRPVTSFDGEMKRPVFLITHTFGRGGVPTDTQTFLDHYADHVVGLCVSGDIRWGSLFALAGDKIRLEYEIPLVRKINIRGYASDVEAVKNWLEEWSQKNPLKKEETTDIAPQ